MKRSGSAVRSGDLKSHKGTISTESGVLDPVAYGFSKRFGNAKDTNPKELIGAAHASCFSMALPLILGEADLTANEIRTSAAVTLEKQGEGFAVTAIHLDLQAKVPGADNAAFRKVAKAAKANCPVSELLNASITMDARLA